MKFTPTAIPEVVIVEPQVFGDHRGYFIECYNKQKFPEAYQHLNFVQDNESKSTKGVLRGLHYQLPPFAQTKLVRVIEGEVLDIVVDIRKGSSTFGKHVSIVLNGDNKKQLLIPRGFAHGFVVLSESAIFSYKCDNYYNLEHERGIAFNDPYLNIDWKLNKDKLILSEKDKVQPTLQKATDLFDFNTNLYE